MSLPRRWTTATALAAALALGGCVTAKLKPVEAAPAPAPVVVAAPPAAAVETARPAPVIVVRSCVPRTLPPPPRYADTDAALRAAPGAADRYQLLAAGRLQRQKRLQELERTVARCRAQQP